jgi:hypothetical protein
MKFRDDPALVQSLTIVAQLVEGDDSMAEIDSRHVMLSPAKLFWFKWQFGGAYHKCKTSSHSRPFFGLTLIVGFCSLNCSATPSTPLVCTDDSISYQLHADILFLLIGPVFLDIGIMRGRDLKNDVFYFTHSPIHTSRSLGLGKSGA